MAKRGRPRFEDTTCELDWVRALYPEIKTRRGVQNKYYELRAGGVIKNMEGIEFLIDLKNNVIKNSILVEIGRMHSEDLMREIAREICLRARTEVHTVKEWVDICKSLKVLMAIRILDGEDILGSRFLNSQKVRA